MIIQTNQVVFPNVITEINYYQKLYESLIAFSLRKVLQEKKKMIKLQRKEEELNEEIASLSAEIEEKEKELERRQKEEEETGKYRSQ